jgi:hypothetical protein
MKNCRNDVIVIVFTFVCVMVVALPAFGYIDPNAAGLVSQILAPLLVAAAAAFTFFRKQLGTALASVSRRLRRRENA